MSQETIRALAMQAQAKNKMAQDKLSELGKLDGKEADDCLSAVKSLNGEVSALKARIEATQAAMSDTDSFTGWHNTATQTAAYPTGTAVTVGNVPAGATVIDASTGAVVDEDGPGNISTKQWKAINEKSYRSAFHSYLKAGSISGMTSASEVKVIQEGLDDSGGFLVPADIIQQLITKKPAPTSTMAYVREFQTNRDRIMVPKVIYTTDNKWTSAVRIQWVGEVPANAAASAVTQPVFGNFEVPVHTGMMNLPITNDQLEDSMVSVMTYLTENFSEAIELEQENLVLNGTGVKQMAGILQNPGGSNEPSTVASGAAAAYTADGLKSLIFALPPQYLPNARWIMSWTDSAQAIEKLKDGNGRYLWGAGVQESGISDSAYNRPLMGFPVSFNQFAPAPTANLYPAIFGDLKGYYFVRRVGFSIQVLNEINAQINQKVLLGRARFGGDVGEDWRLKIQQIHT